jgi:hypothetical protein
MKSGLRELPHVMRFAITRQTDFGDPWRQGKTLRKNIPQPTLTALLRGIQGKFPAADANL